MMRARHNPVQRRRGFTIIEAALSTIIVASMLVAATATFGGIARSHATQTESRLGGMLAQQLMNEILSTAFKQPSGAFGPQSGQTRATYPAVDCYDGYTASPPVSKSGGALTGYTGWKQSARVVYVDPATLAVSGSATTLKQITVTVTAPSGKPYVLVGFRSAFGPYEVAPASQMMYVTGVSVSVTGASPAKAVNTGAHPLNMTTSQ